jgi:hypothetical protein
MDERQMTVWLTLFACITIIICFAIMASCDAAREEQHTKQVLGGHTNAVNHMDFP